MLRLLTENILDREEKTMAEWIECTIGDLCDTISDTYKGNDENVILINTSDVLEGKVLNHIPVPNKNLKGQFKKTFRENDILFSEIRPSNKRFAFVDFKHTSNYIASTKLMVLRHNDRVLPEYLFAILKSTYVLEELQYLAETRSGTFPQITFTSELAPMKVNIPDKKTQNQIVSILSSIEQKININESINNNLLEQALTLYATQFSSLELNGCIGDYCAVKSGFAFKSSWWTNSGIRVIKIGSINQDNLNLLECSYVDEDKADKAKDFVVKAGDLLIAMTGATIGKFAMVPYSSEMLLVNQRVGKFFLGNNPVEKLPFIYCTLKQPEVYGEVVNRGQGSAQPNISASDIMSIPCVIPSKDAINDFNNTSQPLFDLIISNQRENQHLSELRNALLPKLMSGELDVSNIEI